MGDEIFYIVLLCKGEESRDIALVYSLRRASSRISREEGKCACAYFRGGFSHFEIARRGGKMASYSKHNFSFQLILDIWR
ncbi:unknown [Candidatus Apopatosoma intestinale]|nr:unknown [Candidatus Apopatosoma intestinale]